ncbi:dephospho-CoA kinase, partial [Chloroflexota bacterium]
LGQVADDEIVLALPPQEMERAIKGLTKLEKLGFRYPIRRGGAEKDLTKIIFERYPGLKKS